jgi:hypothetical protein
MEAGLGNCRDPQQGCRRLDLLQMLTAAETQPKSTATRLP